MSGFNGFQLTVFVFAICCAPPLAQATPSSEVVTSAQEAESLIRGVLIPGVDQCFNPNHMDYNHKAVAEFTSMAGLVHTLAQGVDLGAAEKSQLSQHLTDLANGRGYLESGFEGSSKPQYPDCQPVNGDIHANRQYQAFTRLMDVDLPPFQQYLSSCGTLRKPCQ